MKLKLLAALLLTLSFLWAPTIYGQVTGATISGAVTDSTGAFIPNVKVAVTNVQTGVSTSTLSNSSGQYTFEFVQPGTYTVNVEQAGFKRFAQTGLTLAAGDHPTIDVPLQTGGIDQTVTVEAASPLLQSADDSLGSLITSKQVEALPLNGRTPMVMAQYTAGVVSTTNPGAVRPFDNSGISAFSVAGLPNKNSEVLMDGAPDTASDNAVAYSPPVDVVEQIRINVFESDASYGHSGGGVANQITKSGTNRFHGSLYEFNQVSALDANSFFANRAGQVKGVSRQNQYGGSFGGPVWIPKVFNGRDKLFFYFGYEGFKDSQPANQTISVPTLAERGGDFSALPYQLYDPYNVTVNADGSYTRSPYKDNKIPSQEFSPIGQAILNYYPNPTPGLGNADGTNDFFSLAKGGDNYTNEFIRVDYTLSDRNRLFFTYRHNNRLQYVNQLLGTSNPALGDFLSRINNGGTASDVYTITPTMVGETRLNFTRYVQNQTATGQGFQSTSLGFPSYLQSNATDLIFPRITFGSNPNGGSGSGYTGLGVPTTSYSLAPYNSYTLFSDLVKIVGKHTIKVGTDLRRFQKGQLTLGNAQGAFAFGNNYLTQTSASSTTIAGQDIASLLIGLPTGGSYDINAQSFSTNAYMSFFGQDDWRIRPDLILNIGLRFDRDFPAYERHGRVVNGFASDTASPIAAAAQAAYAKNPIPQLPASDFAVNGGLTFASQSNRNIYQEESHTFSPRFGFSYTPALLGGKTSVRGGFAIYVLPIFPFNNQVNQEGFSQTTQLVATTNSYQTPNATLANPFPGGILQPVGSSEGLSTFLGQSITYFTPIEKNAYAERWNLGVQHQFPGNTLVEVVYLANHAVKLPITYSPNFVPKEYLSVATAGQPNSASKALNTPSATNPFIGLLPNSGYNAGKVTPAQLLSAYPQYPLYGITVQNAPNGSSYFEALDIRLEKRTSFGLTAIANYQWSKLLERVSYLNPFDSSPELRISQYDHPTHLVAAVTYELPFGKGRRFGGRSHFYTDIPLGGWNISSVYTYQQSAPLNFGNLLPTGIPLDFHPRKTPNNSTPSFNTAAFDTASGDQPQNNLNIRTFPSQFANLRSDAIDNVDASISKNFNFTESSFFQFRFEAFNVNNRPQFAGPNLTPTSSAFGTITGTANNSRIIQLAGKIIF